MSKLKRGNNPIFQIETPVPGLPPSHDEDNFVEQHFGWDAIDKYQAKKSNWKILRARAPHGLSCSSAYWDGAGSRILTTSYDDRIRGQFEINSSRRKLANRAHGLT